MPAITIVFSLNSKMHRWLMAGIATGLTDGLFAVCIAVANGAAISRPWQGVASTLLGKSAYEGGLRTTLIGLAMHFGVALFWSGVFLVLFERSAALRSFVERRGVVITAAIAGPLIWLVMSLGVIPALVHRPPTITARWWIQWIGHAPFVGLPIVWFVSGGPRRRAA